MKMVKHEKTFKFKKGLEDFKTWSKVTDFVFDFFIKKRIRRYQRNNLRKNYKITVKIETYK